MYATNGGYAGGRLYSFRPDLQVNWVDSIPNVSTANPAIGRHGELAIAGGGTVLRVYEGPLAVGETPRSGRKPSAVSGWRASPNPFRHSVTLSLPGSRSCTVYDASGRICARLPVRAGLARWDADAVSPGLYFCRGENRAEVTTIVKQ